MALCPAKNFYDPDGPRPIRTIVFSYSGGLLPPAQVFLIGQVRSPRFARDDRIDRAGLLTVHGI